MEVQLNGMFMDSLEFISTEDRERFDSWSKEQVYAAYLSERHARVAMNIELNRTNRRLAEIKYMACNNDRAE